MPVIEQAKGIMSRSRCGQAQAFDMLRRASQRSNLPVRDLAARIVAKAAGIAPPAAQFTARRTAARCTGRA
jgi:AmiR/NasT family two-component response regulator